MATSAIRQVRIDLPFRQSRVFLFVDPSQEAWNPWWGELFRFLQALAPGRQGWTFEPIQEVFVGRPKLNQQERRKIGAFLKTAPEAEIAAHRTLQRAVRLDSRQVGRLEVTYFSARVPHSQKPRS